MDTFNRDNSLGGSENRRGYQESWDSSQLSDHPNEKQKINNRTFAIDVDRKKQLKFTKNGGPDGDILAENINKFVEIWPNAVKIDLTTKKDSETNKNDFDMIGIVDQKGNMASFNISTFVAIFKNVNYKRDVAGDIRGIKIDSGGENHVIYPDSKQERLDFVFKTIKLAGKELPKDCEISILSPDDLKIEEPILATNWPIKQEASV